MTGVGLADGRHVDGDLVVLACGVRPQVDLARSMGVAVGRGILDDDDLVCTCNAVTAGALRDSGCRTVAEAALATRATTGCGTCADTVAGLLRRPALEKESA